MLENSTFNAEWNKLQKSFWDNIDAKNNQSDLTKINEDHNLPPQLASLFEQWLSKVDECWQEHAKDTSSDINLLYKKLLASSRFIFTSSDSIVATQNDKNAAVLNAQNFAAAASESEETSENENSKDSTNSTHQNSRDFTAEAFMQIPIENWQQQVELFSIQIKQQILSNNTRSLFFDNFKDNAEFSTAVDAYLLALQQYQYLFFDLFSHSAKELIKILKLKKDVPVSFMQIISIYLQTLEAKYQEIISGAEYSKVYGEMMNCWMSMISQSNYTFSDFIQPAPKSHSSRQK